MTNKIQSIRGMQDILADAIPQWQYIEKSIQAVLGRYGYREIRLPILEKTELFERSIGEMTDIVSKEMYTFTDHNGDRLTLRPEGTAGCVRAGLQHSLFYNAIQRLWYMGPMFRHERPQKGRLRQFHQIGVEVFGLDGPDIDAEIIIMCSRIWTEIGLGNLCLQINTLGTTHSRQRYREVLVEYLTDHQDKLDEDSHKRLKRNPLRILDSNNPEMQNLIDSAPRLDDYLDNESQEHFAGLSELLTAAKIDYVVNPRLVRGLDYYCKTVFEWITDQLGAQGTVCAGGRYDGLLEHFGGKATAAIGFALGLERLIALVDNSNINNDNSTPHVYFIVAGEKAKPTAIKLAEMVRDELPNCRLIMHCGGGSFKSQFKKADKSGADIAVILGDDELEKETTTIKQLRQDHEQIEVPWGELCNRINLLVDL